MTQFNPKAVRILSALYRGQTVQLCGFNLVLRDSEVCIRRTAEEVLPVDIDLSKFLKACEGMSEEEVLAATGEDPRYY